MGFTKLDSAIFGSSIMEEERRTKMVWVLMLAAADRDGIVDATHASLARKFNEPLEDVRFAIGVLESPDPQSRSQAEEGRRLVRIDDHRDWGWRIVNYGMYRNTRDSEGRREYKTRWQANRRALDRGEKPPYPDILQGNQGPRESTKVHKVHGGRGGPMQKQKQRQSAEAEAEPEAAGADGVFLTLNPRDGGRPADLSFDGDLLRAIPEFQEMWRYSMTMRTGLSIGTQQLQIDKFAEFCAEHGAAATIAVLDEANLGSWKKPAFKDPTQGNGRGSHREMRRTAGAHEVEQPGPDMTLLAGMVSSLERCKRDGLVEQARETQDEIDGYRSHHHLTDADETAR